MKGRTIVISLKGYGNIPEKWDHHAGANLGGLDEAMRDPTTGLTQAALTGERKQSVKDAERMLSYSVAKFLKENGYEMEGEYVEIVAGWHEAADGRGLTELERCKKNYLMLNMILDEWMPWHRETYGFSTIDINRYRSLQKWHDFFF